METLDKLRQTRDTLNDILTENDQLKIEVTFDTFCLCVCYIVPMLVDCCSFYFASPMIAAPFQV